MTALIAVEPVRAHVQRLRSIGASWQAIGSAAGVGAMTVFDVVHRNAKVSQATAAALLAIDEHDVGQARVDANGAMLRLRSLQAMGHGSARVARAIGCHHQTIQHVVNGRAPTISTWLHQAVVTVFECWWDKRPPETTRAERTAAAAARRRAARMNWCQPAALDEELLDTPGYRPRTGYRPASGAGIASAPSPITQHKAVKSIPRPSTPAATREEHHMPEPDSASSATSASQASPPGVRSVGCACEVASGTPCTPDGDHLDRYVRAAQQGTIDRQTLKQAVAGLTVIAPQAIVPSGAPTSKA